MATTAVAGDRGKRLGTLGARVLGAGLVGATAWIHWHLYQIGYHTLHIIGPLFALNAALGAALAVALLVVPRRWLGLAALGGALFEFGTLGALLLSASVGLFGFTESLSARWAPTSMAVESTGGVLLLALTVVELRDRLTTRVLHARREHAGYSHRRTRLR